MVLFLFVIMLLDLKEEQRRKIPLFSAGLGLVAVAGIASVIIGRLWDGPFVHATVPMNDPKMESTAALGTKLFQNYVLPFEIVSLILLVAMIGTILLEQEGFEMSGIGLEHYLVVSALLFCIGLLGVIIRRNVLVIYLSLELMLNAANLALVAFSRFNNNLNGQLIVFFIITVAASEVAVGLALIVALYRKRQTTHVEDLATMRN